MSKAKDDHEEKSNTTSAGEPTKAAGDKPADAAKHTGTAHYPPSPGDQAGEKTDNIPPAKRLPPDAPDEGADEVTVLKAVNAALSTVVANLGGNPAEITKQVTAGLTPKKAKKTGPMKKATVHGTEVEYPADAEDKDAAAVEAYKAKAGVWHLPATPSVEHHK